MKCVDCKQGDYGPWSGTVPLHGFDIQTDGQACSACGEQLFTAAQMRAVEDRAADLIEQRGAQTDGEREFLRKVRHRTTRIQTKTIRS